ncbi:MAG: hypothetical protein WC055_00685 [Melioribacteraceae bacterium]
MGLSFEEKFSIGGIILIIAIIVIGFIGWCQNISKLIDCDFESPYKTEVIRTVSLVPMIGAITGYMTIGEENK